MPGDFIPLAERTGLIGPISEWVIEEACRQSAEWRSTGLDLYVSVNLPAVFWQPTAMRQVLATIERFGLSADRMMVEITESTVMADALRSEPIIAELHERGLRLAIDDFGTGHSSLARLNQMLVTTLKIDRSFIADLPGDRQRGRARVDHHPARPQPRPASAGGGHRDRGAAHVPGRARLPAGPGLPVLQGRAGRRRSWRCTTPCATPPDYPSGMPITITDAALERVLEVRAREHEPEGLALWVEIVGVAGAAYQYDMSFLRHDEIDETDVVVSSGGLQVVVPRLDAPALDEATIAIDERLGGGLVIENPKLPAQTSPALRLPELPELQGDAADRVRQVLELQVNPAIAVPRRHAELVAVEGDSAFLRLGGGCVGLRHGGGDAEAGRRVGDPGRRCPRSRAWWM